MTIEDEARAAAIERYSSRVIEDYDGDRYDEDEYGYDATARSAFVKGALWAASRREPSDTDEREWEYAWDTLKAKWKAAEQERDHLKTQKDILWQGLNEAKEHIARVEQERDAYAAKDDERAEWVATVEATMAQVYTILKPLATTGTHAANDPVVKACALLAAQDLEAQLAARDRRVAAEAIRHLFDDPILASYPREIRVWDSREAYHAGEPQPIPLAEWIERRADQIENGGGSNARG